MNMIPVGENLIALVTEWRNGSLRILLVLVLIVAMLSLIYVVLKQVNKHNLQRIQRR